MSPLIRGPEPIIVGGFYRSGTSLIRRLLDAHPRIHCPPEIKFFRDFYGDWPEDALSHVRFFSTARSLNLPPSELLRIFGKAYVQCRRQAARRAGKRRWADKNPENCLYLDSWDKLLAGRFFFIHVVRHPLDALSSLEEIGFEKALRRGWDERVQLYRRFMERAAEHTARLNSRSLTVRYEDLVARPDETLRGLFERLGEKFEPSVLTAFSSEERGTGIEDPKAGHSPAIHTRSVGRWKKDLSQDRAAAARSVLGGLFRTFGYDLGG